MAVCYSIRLSETIKHNRWAAEFHQPAFSFKPIDQDKWAKIGRCLSLCQYGLSIQMNEDKIGVPIYRLNEISNAFLDNAPLKSALISERKFVDYRLEKGDVLFCRTNGNINYVGRTGIFLESINAVFASYLVRSRTKKDKLLPEYLTIYLNTPFGRKQILRRAMHSNQVNVSAAELKKIDIYLPDIDAQRKISELLQKSFEKKKTSQSLYTQTQQLLEQELGLDKLKFENPVGYEMDFSEVIEKRRIDAQCYKPEYINYELYLRDNCKFDYLRLLLSSKLKGKQMLVLTSGDIPYASIKNIQSTEIVTDGYCALNSETRIAQRKDLLLAITGATIGKIGLINRYENLAFCGDLLALKTNESIDPYYLLAVMQSSIGQSQCQRWITGSTNGHLSSIDVGKIVIPRLSETSEAIIAKYIKSSLEARFESEQLLEQAKKQVEELIEQAIES